MPAFEFTIVYVCVSCVMVIMWWLFEVMEVCVIDIARV